MTQPDRISADHLPKSVTLHDDYVPGLTDGLYSVAIQQSVTYKDPDKGDQAHHYYRDQRFVVKGPRFALTGGDVHAQFPPEGGNGDYRLILPHITLAKRHLPWERLVRSKAVDGEPAPWLALIVVSQREADKAEAKLGLPDTPDQTLTFRTTASAIYAAGRAPVRRGKISVHLPVLEPEDDETDTETRPLCLDLPAKLAAKLLPSLKDATLLAHLRAVDTTDKAHHNQHGEGDYSVIVANRFPENGANAAYLISLEGWDAFLENPGTLAATDDFLRFVVLEKWDFTNDITGVETFGELSEALSLDRMGALRDVAPDAVAKTAPARLSDGYVPIRYHPSGAAPTWAWYRGPFGALPTEAIKGEAGLAHRADAALVLDEATGAFDISYALAFQYGRARALASPAFLGALHGFMDHAHSVYAAIGDVETWLERHADDVARDWAGELAHLREELSAGNVPAEERQSIRDALLSEGVPRAVVARFTADAAEKRAKAGEDATAKSRSADAVMTWLADLALYQDIPFSHLVPEGTQLPTEALRFFHVDPNWIDFAIDGALSIGVNCASDHDAIKGARPALIDAVSRLVAQRRRFLKGLDGPETQPGRDVADGYLAAAKSGFLLRSKLVGSWPGLEVEVFDKENRKLELIRFDHLGRDVLLIISDGVIAKAVLKEPSEGLRFGIDDDAAVMLRRRKGNPLGAPFQTRDQDAKLTGILHDYLKPGTESGVVDVAKLAAALATAVAGHDQSNPTTFRSAALALQLTRSPEEQTVYWGAPAT